MMHMCVSGQHRFDAADQQLIRQVGLNKYVCSTTLRVAVWR